MRAGRRLRAGEAIYLVAAVLLFVLMFFTWFEMQGTTGGDAWQTLDVTPLFLMLAIVTAVGGALLRLSGSGWKPTVPPAAAVSALGCLAALLILIRIVAPPRPGGALGELIDGHMTPQLPIFLALAAALGIAYGGWRTMAEEGTSFRATAKKLEAPPRPAKSKTARKPALEKKPSAAKRSTSAKPSPRAKS